MPNYCENRLDVYGTKRAVTKFLSTFVPKYVSYDMDVSFARLLPKNEKHRFADTDIYGLEWIQVHLSDPLQVKRGKFDKQKHESDWRFWQQFDVEVSKNHDGNAEISFYSAWSPPLDWVKYAVSKCPDVTLDIRYHEPGMGFAGRFQVTGQEVTVDEQMNVSDPDFKDYLLHLDYEFVN